MARRFIACLLELLQNLGKVFFENFASGSRFVYDAGGDGTLNEVINGLAPLEHRPKLGVIPVGTTNDFARALGIPREDILKAVNTILEWGGVPTAPVR